MNPIPLRQGCFYHVFNCGINGEIIFREPNDYARFHNSIYKYLIPVTDIYAWCLMSNHFHLLFQVKENITYRFSKDSSKADISQKGEDVSFEDVKWLTIDLSASSASDSINKKKKPNPSRHMAHMLSSHTRYINRKYGRHGNLFERPTKRIEISNSQYLRNILVYIHNNPVHHGFCKHPFEYPWSSYHEYINNDPLICKKGTMLKWFTNTESFIHLHEDKSNKYYSENELDIN